VPTVDDRSETASQLATTCVKSRRRSAIDDGVWLSWGSTSAQATRSIASARRLAAQSAEFVAAARKSAAHRPPYYNGQSRCQRGWSGARTDDGSANLRESSSRLLPSFLTVPAMPDRDGDRMYRIKSPLEEHERVVGESLLVRSDGYLQDGDVAALAQSSRRGSITLPKLRIDLADTSGRRARTLEPCISAGAFAKS
jgi:hypothetical protein